MGRFLELFLPTFVILTLFEVEEIAFELKLFFPEGLFFSFSLFLLKPGFRLCTDGSSTDFRVGYLLAKFPYTFAGSWEKFKR